MSARAKITLFMFLLLSFFVGLFAALRLFSDRQLLLVLENDRQDKMRRTDELVKLLASEQRYVTDDYSLWDDVVRFLETKDSEFARLNLETALPSFKVNVVWVYTADGEFVYSINNLRDATLADFPFASEQFAAMLQSRTSGFFATTTHGLMEITAATIHPTGDLGRKVSPSGFLIFGRVIDENDIATLSRLLAGAAVELVPGPVGDFAAAHGIDDRASYSYVKTLDDWRGTPLAHYFVRVRPEMATQMRTAADNFFSAAVAFGFLALGTLFFLLYFFVSRPLRILSANLISKDTSEIKRLEQDSSEFGKLAIALDQFFEQQVKIEQEKARTEALLESIGDGIVGVDRGGIVVFLNSAAARIFHVSSRDAFGRPFRDTMKIIRVRDRVEHSVFVEEALLYGRQATTLDEVVALGENGREIPVVCSASPIFDREKKTTGAVIVVHDAEKEIQSRLLRSDFTYASHQLRTPVTEAMWAVNLALEEREESARRRDIEIAARSIKSVHKLVEHLLEVSQIDQHIVLPKKERVDVRAIAERSIGELQKVARGRQVEVAISPAENVASLETDGKMLERVLFEILENGILYGTARSTVTVAITSEERGVLVSIHNEGRPILERELPLVFTKFFRGSESIDAPGAGLGLYIAREYVKLLGGKIWFTSEYPRGTTFNVFLPHA